MGYGVGKEDSVDLHTFFEIIGIILAVVSGIWVYEQYVQKRLDIMWKRMDEKQNLYFTTFLKREIYENDQKHFKELREEKDGHLLQFFTDKFKSLETSISELKESIKVITNHNNGHK